MMFSASTITIILLMIILIVCFVWLLYLDSLVDDLKGYIARMEREQGWPPHERSFFDNEY
jgi:hypothetical protein